MTVEQREFSAETEAITPPRAIGELAMTPLGLHGPFFNSETGREAAFPRYSFDFDTSRLIDTPTVTRTAIDRLRYTLRVLEETCSEDFPAFEGISQPSVRDSQLKARHAYLKGTIKLNGLSTARYTLIDADLAYTHVAYDLRETQHPAVQLIDQISGATNQLPGVVKAELAQDVLTVVAWTHIRQVLQSQVATQKSQET